MSPHHISQRIQRDRCYTYGENKKEGIRCDAQRKGVASGTNESVVLDAGPVAFSIDIRAVESMLLTQIGFGSLKMFDGLTS